MGEKNANQNNKRKPLIKPLNELSKKCGKRMKLNTGVSKMYVENEWNENNAKKEKRRSKTI